MPDVPAWLLVVGGAAGYAIAFLQYRLAKRASENTVATAARAEILDTYRWAAELAADESEARRQLGINALAELAERPDVTAEDKLLIEAALDVPLAPVQAAWENIERAGESPEPVVVDPDAVQMEKGDRA